MKIDRIIEAFNCRRVAYLLRKLDRIRVLHNALGTP